MNGRDLSNIAGRVLPALVAGIVGGAIAVAALEPLSWDINADSVGTGVTAIATTVLAFITWVYATTARNQREDDREARRQARLLERLELALTSIRAHESELKQGRFSDQRARELADDLVRAQVFVPRTATEQQIHAAIDQCASALFAILDRTKVHVSLTLEQGACHRTVVDLRNTITTFLKALPAEYG